MHWHTGNAPFTCALFELNFTHIHKVRIPEPPGSWGDPSQSTKRTLSSGSGEGLLTCRRPPHLVAEIRGSAAAAASLTINCVRAALSLGSHTWAGETVLLHGLAQLMGREEHSTPTSCVRAVLSSWLGHESREIERLSHSWRVGKVLPHVSAELI